MENIQTINTEIKEGRVLLVALGRLSCIREYSSKTPNEIYTEMVNLATEVFEDES